MGVDRKTGQRTWGDFHIYVTMSGEVSHESPIMLPDMQNSDFSPFQSVSVHNDKIIATLPAAPRWFVQASSAGARWLSQPGESFTLQAGSSLRLVEKHSSYQATAQLAPTPGLRIESTFDASDFGGVITNRSYFISAK